MVKENSVNKLFGAIAGLFLFYDIQPDKGGGKIVTDRLKEVEKDFKEIQKECEKYKKLFREIESIVKDFNIERMCFYDDINECETCDMSTDCNYLRRIKLLNIIRKAKDNK